MSETGEQDVAHMRVCMQVCVYEDEEEKIFRTNVHTHTEREKERERQASEGGDV